MVYIPTIPQPGDSPATQSQAQILENFTQLNTQFSVDHVALNAGANNGKHIKTTFIDQAADPVVAANEIDLYSKSLAGVSTLYLRKESNGTVIQMSAQDPTINNAGSTFLPGGVIIKWGFGPASPGGNVIAFASAFPTNCWVVLITPEGGTGRAVSVNNKNVNNFTAICTNNITMGYIAIGN